MYLEWNLRDLLILVWREMKEWLIHNSPCGRAREARRRKQEMEYRLSEIDAEEEYILLHSPPKPRNPASRWMAVRLGKVVAEGMERAEVVQSIARIQMFDPWYCAIIVEVGVPLEIPKRF